MTTTEGKDSQPANKTPYKSNVDVPINMQRRFDGIQHCSASTGIPLVLLKRSKKDGCPAFRNNRVDLAEWIKWFFTQEDTELEAGKSWPDELAKFKAKREEIRLEQDKGKTVDRQEVVTAISKSEAIGDSFLDRQFNVTLPADLAGRDAAYISRRLIDVKLEFNRLRKAEHEKLARNT